MRKRLIINLALSLLTAIAISCGNNGGKRGKDCKQQVASEVPDTTNIAIEEEKEVSDVPEPIFRNPFFTPYNEIEDLVDAADETLTSPVCKGIDLGKGFGRATLSIQRDSGSKLNGVLKTDDRTYVLYPMSDNDGAAYFLTVCAYDLDGDGLKELMVHDGDMFSLMIFRMKQSGPEYVGMMSCNWGWFITDDHLIVSFMGSQGGATLARYKNGKLDIIDETYYVDKVMRSSKDFMNLRYKFDDNEKECHEIEKIYPADRYIICDQESIYGNNCFSVDLDGDGRREQLYLSRPGWGATCGDEILVILPGTRTSFSLTGDILEDNDPRAVEVGEFDWRFVNLVQLSAKDVNGDGNLEIVASLGSREDHVDYVWSFDRKNGTKMIMKK